MTGEYISEREWFYMTTIASLQQDVAALTAAVQQLLAQMAAGNGATVIDATDQAALDATDAQVQAEFAAVSAVLAPPPAAAAAPDTAPAPEASETASAPTGSGV